ncbi:cystathionine gamma-synthase [Lentisalinibacter orientalis]|uniref:cystathionine gamma-synthase n=1 Tax=Lentisalinibacter orientalis TaxID=2992241 RepID=UPI003862DAE2
MTQGPQSATQAVRAALESDAQYGAVVPPLHLSSNYTFEGFGRPRQYDYTRSGNPTRDALGRALTELEGGAGAVVTASGMSAITLVCQLLRPGDLLIAPHDCYGGSFRLFRNLADRGAFDLEFVDQTDVRALEAACSRGPRLIWVETPSNPLLRVTDINRVVGLARDCGALVAVDNTFLSPALQQPLALGADLVVHSTTKYLNGHSDVVGGAVVAGDEALASELADWANCIGITGAPFDSYLTLRGVRTLFARMRQHEENAAALAEFLAGHEQVARVYYPGLESHPGHLIAARQQSGFGGMVSFELRGGIEDARRIAEGLVHFSLAESLGGVESLVCHPATMTHAPMTPEARTAAGISDSLIRLSVGIESATDLIGDLERALDGLGARGDLRAVAG